MNIPGKHAGKKLLAAASMALFLNACAPALTLIYPEEDKVSNCAGETRDRIAQAIADLVENVQYVNWNGISQVCEEEWIDCGEKSVDELRQLYHDAIAHLQTLDPGAIFCFVGDGNSKYPMGYASNGDLIAMNIDCLNHTTFIQSTLLHEAVHNIEQQRGITAHEEHSKGRYDHIFLLADLAKEAAKVGESKKPKPPFDPNAELIWMPQCKFNE